MPRKSLAEIILTEVKDIDTNDDLYLVIYDFKMAYRRSIPDKFYKNLSRIMETGKCKFVQKSVILCENYLIAKAIARLAHHYGADVKIYKVFPIS